MARTRNAAKRQKLQKVEAALFNPDVAFLLAALLDARDLCRASLTCKALGAKRDHGPSLVEEAARRQFECASVWERSCLPKYDGEGWIELYHHLLMLRSELTFDRLLARNIRHGADASTVTRKTNSGSSASATALCSNHVMRAGRHFAHFTATRSEMIGVIRPNIQVNASDFDEYVELNGTLAHLIGSYRSQGEVTEFTPGIQEFWRYLMSYRTARWSDSNVHCCYCIFVGTEDEDEDEDEDEVGHHFCCFDWASGPVPGRMIGNLNQSLPIGLLLDLNEGSLSIYQDGRRFATLKDGLSGEYCWYGTVWHDHESISIRRGSTSDE
ncbi:hypothetical protein THAOC_33309 [Thalassiosira oceanica]|uniref:B30.2/SPRY domain-containing protein n=1 Tax=Thalassiosira oceanica TaxID=159749 RepID=K0RG21_THAOC|nr:hypothetical protein THAOC_33309 [Thalassiosira oceanica]|eukprot:EJK47936.1 hypothetical protein THAOC_33309 [Thalassiosira oceanica]